MRNAQSVAKDIEAEIAELREVAHRVSRGYEWWDRHGFEIALDAYGEPWRWQELAESVTPDFVFSNDEFDARRPVDVQRAYGRAFESGLFSRFEVDPGSCSPSSRVHGSSKRRNSERSLRRVRCRRRHSRRRHGGRLGVAASDPEVRDNGCDDDARDDPDDHLCHVLDSPSSDVRA